jgi:starch synthase (maltosyl-transferring)
MAEYYRPNFFANTPDINPVYLQTSGPPGFVVRGTLAATLSSVYGIYSGFELAEGTPLPGKEEYLDSEKYEIRAWDYDRPGNIREHITKLNRIRRENPALWDFRNIVFLNAWNDNVLSYLRMTRAKDNALLILVNLDPHNRQDCTYEVPLWEFGLPDDGALEAEDLLGGGRFRLNGKTHRIALDPAERPVVIWRLSRP